MVFFSSLFLSVAGHGHNVVYRLNRPGAKTCGALLAVFLERDGSFDNQAPEPLEILRAVPAKFQSDFERMRENDFSHSNLRFCFENFRQPRGGSVLSALVLDQNQE